jgi:ABC-type bacteriocin/lantibiotic exporter with double-glycine peptidase domain
MTIIISCIAVITLMVTVYEIRINKLNKKIRKQKDDISHRNSLLLEFVKAGDDLIKDFTAMKDVLEDSFGVEKAYNMFVKRKKRNEEGSDINNYLKDALKKYKN